MTTLRLALFVLAALSLGCLRFTPPSLASFALAGFFFACFVALCATYGAFNRQEADHAVDS